MLNSQTTNPSGHSAKKETPATKSLLSQKRSLNTKELYDILLDESTTSLNESFGRSNLNQAQIVPTERYSC